MELLKKISLSNKKTELVLFTTLILTAIFFRFWQIRNYVVFLGDEGRDMLILREIFTKGNIPFLGPTASVGGFYLGPIYYWMTAPFLLFSRFDPIGPSYLIAALGVATVYLLFRFIRENLGFWPAILASSLYCIAPLIVRYSRSSWNPNPLPFFSLLMFYFIYLALKNKKLVYHIVAGACFGIAIQLHYLALLLAILAGIVILVNSSYKKWIQFAVLYLVGFIITFSPFLLFEIKHSFPNFKTILEFVTRGSTLGYSQFNFLWLISSTGNIFLEELSFLKQTIITKIAFWTLVLSSLCAIYKYWKEAKLRIIVSTAIIWFFGGLLFVKLYTGSIYDYYFEFMFPAPFILLGLTFYLIWNKNFFKYIACLTTVIILIFFISKAFFWTPPNKLITQTETVADFVIEKTHKEPYNFALISDSNSDHAYRYFLEVKGHKPVQLETLITDQLLIVCESKKCSPLGHPLWEIAGFGRGDIVGEWELKDFGFKVFRLTHWEGEPSPAGKPAVKGFKSLLNYMSYNYSL